MKPGLCTPPLPYRPFVKLRGHNDWVKGAVVFRDGRFVLSHGGNELFVWDLHKVKQQLEHQVKGEEFKTQHFVPSFLRGHAARVQKACVFIGRKGDRRDNTYRALSLSKDKTIIEWNLDIAQEEGRTKEKGIQEALKLQMEEKANSKPKRHRNLYKKKQPIKKEQDEGDSEEEEEKEEDEESQPPAEEESIFPSLNAHS